MWASSWLSTSRSQPSWFPKLSLPSGETARIVTSGYGSGEANPFGRSSESTSTSWTRPTFTP